MPHNWTNLLTWFCFQGSEIVSTFDNPEYVKLGSCDLIEETMIGEDKLLKFSGLFTETTDKPCCKLIIQLSLTAAMASDSSSTAYCY